MIAGGGVEVAADASNSNADACGSDDDSDFDAAAAVRAANHEAVLARLDDIMNPGNVNVVDDDVDNNPAKMPAKYIYSMLAHAR